MSESQHTRLEALMEMDQKTPSIKDQIVITLKKAPYPLSTSEIAASLGKPYCNVQPRIAELRKAGIIKDSEDRALSPFKKHVILWTMTEPALD